MKNVIRRIQHRVGSIAPNIIICLLVAVILAACRKKDEVHPTVIIQLPSALASFDFGEFLHITATVSDDQKIETVVLQIINSNNIAVLAPVHINGNGNKELEIETTIEFNDVHLESGAYHVQVTASDGENEKNAFREIHLNAAPLILKKIFLIRKPFSNTTQMDSLDANSTWQPAFSLPIGYSEGEINSYHQTMSLAGFDFDGITTLDASGFQILNTVSTSYDLSDEVFTCTALDQHHHLLYFGGADGKVRSINQFGIVSRTFELGNNFIPRQLAISNDRLLVYSESFNQQQLDVFNKNNGAFLQSLSVDADNIVALIEKKTGEDFWLVGNDDGDAVAWEYFIDENIIDQFPTPLQSNEDVLAVCDGLDGIYLAFENSTRFYQETDWLIFSGASGPALAVLHMQYDPVNDALFALEENSLHMLNSNASAIVESFSTPADAADFLLLYNK
ncbi:MAG: hypothetical protein SH856_01045 [Flavobacteriales bacterium]|nr:hypothetical protein [Flavobacteriales bacterium]